MDFLSLLSSVSKLAIFAFVVTFVIILIELYLMSKNKDTQPVKKEVEVPDFSQQGNDKQRVLHIQQPKKIKTDEKKENKLGKLVVNVIAGALILLIIGGGYYLYNYFINPPTPEERAALEPLPSADQPAVIDDGEEGVNDEEDTEGEEGVESELSPTIGEEEDSGGDHDEGDVSVTPVDSGNKKGSPSPNPTTGTNKGGSPSPTDVLIAETTPSEDNSPTPAITKSVTKAPSNTSAPSATPVKSLPIASGYHVTLIIAAASVAMIVFAFIL